MTECLSSVMSADAREVFARPAGFRAECPLASGRDPSGEHLPSCLRIGHREPSLDLCSARRRRTRLASGPPLKARPAAALSPRCGARRLRNAPALLSSETPWRQSNSPGGSLATPRMGYAVPLAGKSFSTQGDRRRRAPMTRHDWHRYWDANDGASWVPPSHHPRRGGRTRRGLRVARQSRPSKRPLDGFRAGGDSQLGVDVLQVCLDRVHRHNAFACDLGVGEARGQEPQHQQLALGEDCRRLARRAAEPVRRTKRHRQVSMARPAGRYS